MLGGENDVLTDKQLASYEELGFVHSIPILSESEVCYYRAAIEETCRALGDRVSRIDAGHLFFHWAWDLSTHPRLLDCMEKLLGPNILLKSTRLFYKHGESPSFVGWHQDGITERIEDSCVPGVWIGLTSSTVENGRSQYRWAVFTMTPETKGCRRRINSVHASSVFARRHSSSNCCAVNSLSFIEPCLNAGIVSQTL